MFGNFQPRFPQAQQVFGCTECSYAFVSDVFLQKHMKRTHNDVYIRMLRNRASSTSAACQQVASSVTSQEQGDTDEPRSHGRQQLTQIITQPGRVKAHYTGEETIIRKQSVNILSHFGHLNTPRRIHTEENLSYSVTSRTRGDASEPRSYSQQFIRMLTRPAEAKTRQTTCAGNKPAINDKNCKQSVNAFRHLGCLDARERGVPPEDKPFRCQRVPPEDKPFRCQRCDKGFRRIGTLNRHQRIHTGEKPFGCTQCDKRFNQLDHLKMHQRHHTGERPFHCTQCDKSFSQLGVLKRHLSTHTGEKPFRCVRCDMSFGRLGSLGRHQRVHAGERAAT